MSTDVQLQLWFIQIKGYIREPLVLKAKTLPLDQTYLTTSDTKFIGIKQKSNHFTMRSQKQQLNVLSKLKIVIPFQS